MTFESLKRKINVLDIVRQRVPGCGTCVGKRPFPVRGQIDTGEVQMKDIERKRFMLGGSKDTVSERDSTSRRPGAIVRHLADKFCPGHRRCRGH